MIRGTSWPLDHRALIYELGVWRHKVAIDQNTFRMVHATINANQSRTSLITQPCDARVVLSPLGQVRVVHFHLE